MKDVAISKKLLLLVTVLAILIAVVGIAGRVGMGSVYKNQNDITSRQVPAMNFLRAADIDLYQAMQSLYLMEHQIPGSEAFEAELKNYRKNIGQADERFQSYVDLMKRSGKNDAVKQFKTDFGTWKSGAEEIIAARQNNNTVDDKMAEAAKGFDHIEELLDGIADSCMEDIKSNTTLSLSQFKTTTTILIGLILVSIVASLLLGMKIAGSILVPLKKIVAFANRVQQGNLSEKLNLKQSDEIGHLSESIDLMVESLYKKAVIAEEIADGNLAVDVMLSSDEDYLGESLKNMVDNLNHTIEQIQKSSGEVSLRANSFSEASDSLSQGASKQAASLEEISASLTEVDSETQQNITHAKEVNALTTSATRAVDEGNSNMAKMIEAMGEINNSSTQIQSVIKVIDDIAFQTNLLALNAAVEAARAGTHGKGFAVVADEVRSLANRSSKAAKETASLIKTAVDNVENGTHISTQTATSLELIEAKIKEVTELVDKIVSSSELQGEGLRQVVVGLEEIDMVTNQTAAHAEETASAATELARFSQELREVAAQFSLGDVADE